MADVSCFQSHYGLILSGKLYNLARSLISLSIPLWSDFIRYSLLKILMNSLYFQSHYGLILSVSGGRKVQEVCEAFNPTMVWFYRESSRCQQCQSPDLSIPLWSDFIERRESSNQVLRQAFNPTMVWFYLQQAQLLPPPPVLAFNPTMVWFYLKIKDRKNNKVHELKAFNPTMVWFYPKITK